MKNIFNINLICSECGEILDIINDKSETIYNSTFDVTSKIYIQPCKNCKEKYSEPLKLMKKLSKLI